MRVKKFIKLINNERVDARLASIKACESMSTDTCTTFDNADCAVNSYDVYSKLLIGFESQLN